jgi:hypothetical protein
MNAAHLLRHRLALVVAAEVLIVVAFCGAAWHVWHSRQVGPGLAARQPPAATSTAPTSIPSVPAPPTVPGVSPPPPRSGPTPGIRTDGDFLLRQMRDLNHDQSALEGAEWRAVKAVIDAARSYLQTVVLPAVGRAERGR